MHTRHPDRSVTVAITRKVAPGREDEFAQIAKDLSGAASRYPGHLGAGHLRASEPGGEHAIVYRFDSPEHLEAWQSSDERHRLLERLETIIEGAPRIERATGLEYWFTDSTCPSAPPPPAWKQSVATWIGLFPTVYLLSNTINALWAELPGILSTMASTGLTVALMTSLIMPAVSRLLRPWLRPEHERHATA